MTSNKHKCFSWAQCALASRYNSDSERNFFPSSSSLLPLIQGHKAHHNTNDEISTK